MVISDGYFKQYLTQISSICMPSLLQIPCIMPIRLLIVNFFIVWRVIRFALRVNSNFFLLSGKQGIVGMVVRVGFAGVAASGGNALGAGEDGARRLARDASGAVHVRFV